MKKNSHQLNINIYINTNTKKGKHMIVFINYLYDFIFPLKYFLMV